MTTLDRFSSKRNHKIFWPLRKKFPNIAILGPKIRFFEKCQNGCFFTFLPKINAKSGVSDSELQNHSYMGKGKNGPRRVKNEVFGISSPRSCHPISRWIQKRSETLATDPNRSLFWRKSYTANPLGWSYIYRKPPLILFLERNFRHQLLCFPLS